MFTQRVWNKEVSVRFGYRKCLSRAAGEWGKSYFSVHIQNAKICEPWNRRRRSAFG